MCADRVKDIINCYIVGMICKVSCQQKRWKCANDCDTGMIFRRRNIHWHDWFRQLQLLETKHILIYLNWCVCRFFFLFAIGTRWVITFVKAYSSLWVWRKKTHAHIHPFPSGVRANGFLHLQQIKCNHCSCEHCSFKSTGDACEYDETDGKYVTNKIVFFYFHSLAVDMEY